VISALVGVAAALAVCGCAQDRTSGLNEPSPPPNRGLLAVFAPKPAPELDLKQGQKLMTEIKKNPMRLDKLTPQEKRFLAKAFATKQYLDDEEANGRR
jgi:hypothetical protein